MEDCEYGCMPMDHGELTITGAESQELFESLFPADHKPKIDTRTPEDVALGAEIGDV